MIAAVCLNLAASKPALELGNLRRAVGVGKVGTISGRKWGSFQDSPKKPLIEVREVATLAVDNIFDRVGEMFFGLQALWSAINEHMESHAAIIEALI